MRCSKQSSRRLGNTMSNRARGLNAPAKLKSRFDRTEKERKLRFRRSITFRKISRRRRRGALNTMTVKFDY